MQTSRAFHAGLVVVSIAVAACASSVQRLDLTPVQLAGSSEPRGIDRTANQILAADLREVQGYTAADAVRQLRPSFLRFRLAKSMSSGPVLPSVFLDGRFAGGIDVLSSIPIAPVLEIRYVAASEAKSLYGSYCACDAGIIAVRTRVGR